MYVDENYLELASKRNAAVRGVVFEWLRWLSEIIGCVRGMRWWTVTTCMRWWTVATCMRWRTVDDSWKGFPALACNETITARSHGTPFALICPPGHNSLPTATNPTARCKDNVDYQVLHKHCHARFKHYKPDSTAHTPTRYLRRSPRHNSLPRTANPHHAVKTTQTKHVAQAMVRLI